MNPVGNLIKILDMLYIWQVMLILLNGFWLAMVLFALPGNWLMVITSCLLAWWKWGTVIFSLPLLITIAVLALVGELIEFYADAHTFKFNKI